jgi:hypothetical protein
MDDDADQGRTCCVSSGGRSDPRCRQTETLSSPARLRDRAKILTSQGPAHDDIRDAGKAQVTPMSWADTVRATALAALAGRTTTAARTAVDTPWTWNPHDVWLTRASQPRQPAAQPSVRDPSTPPDQDTALHD